MVCRKPSECHISNDFSLTFEPHHSRVLAELCDSAPCAHWWNARSVFFMLAISKHSTDCWQRYCPDKLRTSWPRLPACRV